VCAAEAAARQARLELDQQVVAEDPPSAEPAEATEGQVKHERVLPQAKGQRGGRGGSRAGRRPKRELPASPAAPSRTVPLAEAEPPAGASALPRREGRGPRPDRRPLRPLAALSPVSTTVLTPVATPRRAAEAISAALLSPQAPVTPESFPLSSSAEPEGETPEGTLRSAPKSRPRHGHRPREKPTEASPPSSPVARPQQQAHRKARPPAGGEERTR
jgi:hypothetical protein